MHFQVAVCIEHVELLGYRVDRHIRIKGNFQLSFLSVLGRNDDYTIGGHRTVDGSGGTIFQEEQCIAKNPMPRALAEEIANDMWTRSEGQGEVMLSGQNTAYLMERGLGMLQRVQFVGNHYQIIHSPAEVPEDITKVSVYLHEGVENYVERFVPRWKQANCAVAGPFWIDTTFANKGIGVQCVCRTLGIDPAQVMAFGDNYNDETMLDVVGVPYIMDNAAAPLRAKYKNHTPRPEDVLAQLLAQQP